MQSIPPIRCDDTCRCEDNSHSFLQTNLVTKQRCQCQLMLLTSSPGVSNSWQIRNWHHSWTFTSPGGVICDCNTFLALKTQDFPRPFHSDLESHTIHIVNLIHFPIVFHCCFTNFSFCSSFRFLLACCFRYLQQPWNQRIRLQVVRDLVMARNSSVRLTKRLRNLCQPLGDW